MGHVLFLRKGLVHTAPVTGIRAGSLAVGSVVKLMEDSGAVEYRVVHQGKPSDLYDDSCDGTWLMREYLYGTREWSSTNSNNYSASGIHEWINGYFFNNILGSTEQAVIKSVKIPYVDGTGGSAIASGANGLSCKLFLLSGYELGWTTSTNSYFPVDGAKLAYFESGTGISANNKRIAYTNGSATGWWLRSPIASSSRSVWYVLADGDYDDRLASYSYGARYALVLPYTAKFDKDTLVLKV